MRKEKIPCSCCGRKMEFISQGAYYKCLCGMIRKPAETKISAGKKEKPVGW